MSELTKEWLQQTIAELEEERDAVPGVVNEDATMALAAMKLALASLEAEKNAEPVAKVETVGVCWYADNGVPRKPVLGTELYTAPPAPASVPDVVSWEDVPEEITEDDIALASAWAHGFNQCRAAMLQGAEPVSQPYTLPDPIKDNHLNSGAEADDYYSGYQDGCNELYEALSDKSLVIPHGWVLVPIEPTYQMCEAMGLQWESPRFPDRYKAMIAAVKNDS